ncbi:tRNA (adenosine(37)-N6)-threonylcarbamoyltransferase complex ATPase subunit type 1 TsaE [Haloferula sp.]|uniref:tRNA (adenosine(37)-N6)-threonylcarbamoyltransferase complex ATPase subunit type 1 TsaE n=1 Tax=Haloferula sp. TaxID=2497595 RepID=UPI003C748E2B
MVDETAMENLGREVAADLGSGAVLGLVGGLGAGKTHFAKGLVSGLGFSGPVTSPTFALVHEYRGGKLPVFHFDFYRLDSAEALLGIGWDEFLDEGGLVIAEWADLYPELMPEPTRWLKFEVRPDGSRGVEELAGP